MFLLICCATEIVISGGMSIPEVLTTLDAQAIHAATLGKFSVPPV